jgi:peptide/nickel transport system permease protein
MRGMMWKYFSGRLGTALLSVIGVTIVVFVVSHVLPGDAAAVRAGQYASPEQIARIRSQYGLNKPLPAQFGEYLSGIAHGDLGTSIRTGQPVLDELTTRLPATLELSLAALLVSLLVGVPLGALAAAKRGSVWDAVVRVLTLVVSSTAVFWVGLMAIYFLCNRLHVFPSPIGRLPRDVDAPGHITGFFVLDALLEGRIGLAGTALRSLLLPALTLGLITAAPVIKIVRSAMASALASDYVRTATAFGVPRRAILRQDAFRNSLLPVLTSVGIVAGYLIGGNIIIEQLFSWPGIGQFAYESLQAHDLDAIQGFVLLVGVGYVALNFVLDFAYAAADPRVELQGAL